MMKNKKSQLFMVILFLIVLISFTSLYAILLTKKNGFEEEIGERQFAVFTANENAQKVLFYIDQSVELASRDAAIQLAENGGFYKAKCGKYFNYVIWDNNKPECMPTKPQDNYEKYFELQFQDILKKYPDYKIPLNYYFEFTDDYNKFHGKIGEPIIINIEK